jgi:hypothetical protein
MRSIILIALIAASPAAAEIKSSGPNGFVVERSFIVAARPEAVFAQIGRIGEWWDVAHSYSGRAENLRLDLKAGGCFCETLANGGSVEHMRVVYADPASGIRMQGGLGPLQSEAVTGTLSWSFKTISGGTQVTQRYTVAGQTAGGIASFAEPVDQVLGEQFARLEKKLKR